MVSMLQGVPKHKCNRQYGQTDGVLGKIDNSLTLIPLYYCDKCDVYEFYGREFKTLNDADKFIKENKNKLEKLSAQF